MMTAKVNHSSTQYRGRVFTLDKENVTLGNGVTTDLGKIIPVPGYSDETITLFLCTGLTLKQQKLDADEQITVSPVPFDEAVAMVHDGRIQDAKSIAGLFMTRQHLEKQTRKSGVDEVPL